MKPVMWLALIACLVGLAFQLKAIDEGGGEKVLGSSNGLTFEQNERREAATEVTKSTRTRVVSDRRVYFDFDRLEIGPAAQRFQHVHPGMEEMLVKRRQLDDAVRALKAQGLAGRHPDVLTVTEVMKPLEEEIVKKWREYQSRRMERRAKE